MSLFENNQRSGSDLPKRHRNPPNTEELDVDVDGESLLESRTLLPPKRVILGIHLVGERNLLPVVGREESDLGGGGEVTLTGEKGRPSTLASIPARARAVYAPLENPKMQILSPSWSKMEELSYSTTCPLKGLTMLHQKFVTS